MYDPALQSAYAVLEKFYADQEPELARLRAQSSCSPSCTICCNQYLRTSVLEALHMSELMVAHTATVVEYEEKQKSVGIDFVKWLEMKIPCMFLVNGRCVVYANRPWICRSHFASSPPEFCGELTTKNVVLGIRHMTPAYFAMHEEATKCLPLPYGAIPLYQALRWGNLYKDGGLYALYEVVRKESGKQNERDR